MAYQQLTLEERSMICGFCKAGFSNNQIAQELGRHKSTIGRELKRNKGMKGYRPKQANEMAKERKQTSDKAIKWTPECEDKIVTLLKENWSPEQISHRLKKDGSICISHQRIYQFIREDKAKGGTLYTHLRQGHKKRRKKYGKSTSKRGQITNRVSIHDRPAHIDERLECGHWEGDTIIGKNHKKAMITLVERKYGFSIIEKVESKRSDHVAAKIIEVMSRYKDKVKTLTFDNGLEFAEHEAIAKGLECSIYFANPYSSWQRGTNENTNGLFRQYFPKGSDFDTYSEIDVTYAMDSLNNRPRKRLSFFTPNELFFTEKGCT
jgi:IS30 family transposase